MTLWDGWPPPSTPDENSQEAAESVILSAGTWRRRVAEYVAEHGPVAEWQIERGLRLAGNTTRPRVWELHRAGVIRRIEAKGTTPSGRACWRYVVVLGWRAYLMDAE